MDVDQAILKLTYDSATSATATTPNAPRGYVAEIWVSHAGGATFSLTITETNEAGTQTILSLTDETVAANVQYPVERAMVDVNGDAIASRYGAYLVCGQLSATLSYNTSVTGDSYIAIRYTA